MGVTESHLISRSKQSRKRNSSATPRQLARTRGAEPGQTGDDLSSRRCIVTTCNLRPGYRHEQGAGKMDSRQKSQNGRGDSYGGDSVGSERSLMSLVSFIVLVMVLILPQCAASDPCLGSVVLEDDWRDVSITHDNKTDNCDKGRFETDKWYSFRLDGMVASIPTTCVKNNMCGSKIAMRVELYDQELPQEVGENMTATLCGSYDVLGMYDCCVLRSEVIIARCQDDSFVYQFPHKFDRCPVAVCAQGKDIDVPSEAKAKMGEVITNDVLTATVATPVTTFHSLELDVTTTDASQVNVLTDETTGIHLPPQSLMQQTTSLDPPAYTSEDRTSESTISTVSSDHTGTESNSEASNTSTDASPLSDSTSKTNNETFVSSPANTDVLTDLYPGDLSSDTSTSSTQSPHISTEAASTEIMTLATKVQISTSETPSHISSSLDPNIVDVIGEETTLDELYSTRNELSSDQFSTVSKLPEEPDTSGIFVMGNDTILTSTTPQEESNTTSVSSPLFQTSILMTKLDAITVTLPMSGSHVTNSRIKPNVPIIISTSSTRPDRTNATQQIPWDIVATENIRLVFKGHPEVVAPTSTVLVLLDKFLNMVSQDLRDKGGSQWTYEVQNISDAVNFEDRKTYMDFKIKHSSHDFQEMTQIFRRYHLATFISENSNMTLLAECRRNASCQYDAFEGAALGSVFQKNAPAFITVIVLCSICVFILVVAVLYSRLSKRGSWKATSDMDGPNSRHYISGNQSPFTDAQIMKDEMVDDASFNGSAKDGDTNLNSTWVIPLDQDPSSKKTVVSIATEDTKF